jgi:hypothetical protein
MATNAKPGILRNLRIKRVDLVDMGANFDPTTGDGAHILLFKSAVGKDGPSLGSVHVDSPAWDVADQDEYEKATLSGESRRGLPDSAFAAVWTDAQGNKHRKLPIHDAGHLAAARGRVDGAQIPEDVKAAARHKIDAASNKENSVAKTLKEFLKSLTAAMAEPDATKRAALLKAAEEDAEKVAAAPPPPAPPKDGPPAPGTPAHEAGEDHAINQLTALHPDHAKMVKAQCDDMAKAIDSYGPGPHPDGHPVHALKAAYDSLMKVAGPPVPPPTPEKKEAAVDPSVTKRFTDLEKRNTELMTQLTVEKNIRLDREMVDILKGFKATPFKLEGEDNDISKFRKMKETDPAAFERTIEILKATDAQLASSALYKNVGSSRSGGGPGSAWAQIEALAEKIVEKSADGSLTFEKAIDRVLMDPKNNKLVAQYRSEQQ